MIRFMGKIYTSTKGVLGVDLGAGSTTLAVGKNGQVTNIVSVFGTDLRSMQEHILQLKISELTPWIGYNLSENTIREYLLNKTLYPATVATTKEDLAIEYAFVRYRLAAAIADFHALVPRPTNQFP